MPTEARGGAPSRLEDVPWRRLPAELGIAAVFWGLILYGLGSAISYPVLKEPAERPIDAQLVELPTPPPPTPTPAPPTPRPPEPTPAPERPRAQPRSAPHQVSAPVAAPVRPQVVSLPRTHVPDAAVPAHEALPTAPPEAPTQPAASAMPEGPPGGGRLGARVVSQPMPEIPAELRDRPVSVVATARFNVSAEGQATVTLVNPTTDPRLNRWLLGVLKTWTFFPAVEDGEPVDSVLDIRIPIEIR